jgi:NAD(P)-dependent dehydrogenase (short-subunit alcohol dehydrogenase family)
VPFIYDLCASSIIISSLNSIGDIIAATGNPDVVVKHLDLSCFTSVRKFAEDINRTEDRLDVLVHNAGYAGFFTSAKSIDGLELTMATNHYGPFLLTHLLIDLLKRSAPSRIVVVSSALFILGQVDLSNLNPLTVLPGYLYYVSKRANMMFTEELARRLAANGGGVTANSLHPGLIDTGIWRNVHQPAKSFINFCCMFAKTMRQGAQTSIYASTAPELEKVNGKFFEECGLYFKQFQHDPKQLNEFWEQSVGLCGLGTSDPKI